MYFSMSKLNFYAGNVFDMLTLAISRIMNRLFVTTGSILVSYPTDGVAFLMTKLARRMDC